jgi:hypothetical protein
MGAFTKIRSLLTACLLVVVTSGCFEANNKFYRDSDIVSDKRLEGQFRSSDPQTNSPSYQPVVIKSSEHGHYTAVWTEDSKWIKLDVVLFKCGGNLFLDMSRVADNGVNEEPAVGPGGLELLHMATLYNTHSVVRVRFTEKGFDVGWNHGNPVYDVLKQYRYLKFRAGTETEPLDRHQKILTNPTDELYEFLQTAGTNDSVFGFHGGLIRIPAGGR